MKVGAARGLSLRHRRAGGDGADIATRSCIYRTNERQSYHHSTKEPFVLSEKAWRGAAWRTAHSLPIAASRVSPVRARWPRDRWLASTGALGMLGLVVQGDCDVAVRQDPRPDLGGAGVGREAYSHLSEGVLRDRYGMLVHEDRP